MSIAQFCIAMTFTVAIVLGLYGFFRFFRFLPEYLRERPSGPKSILYFRYGEYNNWLKQNDKNHGNGPLYFAAGFALSLMTFPFLLVT
ncbi:MAG: hypothetical protein ABJO09_14940 [Hyphomicrobiales bacterium]